MDCGACCGRRSRRRRRRATRNLERVGTLIADGRRQQRQSCAARRQDPAVQCRAHGLHHVPGGRPQLGGDGGPGRSDRGLRTFGLGVSGELRCNGGLAGVLSGQAAKSALVHRSRVEPQQTRRGGTRAARLVFAGGFRPAPTCAKLTGVRTATARRSRSCRARMSARFYRNCARCPTPGLRKRTRPRKRFSLGFFDERYIMHFDCGVVRRGGAIVRLRQYLARGLE